MTKKKAVENESLNAEILETFPDQEAMVDTKATIDGVFIVDGRIAICDTEDEAFAIYRACFRTDPIDVTVGTRKPTSDEKVLHYRGPDKLPYYGRFE